ncbi:hypothetical protein J41TS12_41560 [Paenibacillus antibioticophila]|uniref:Phage tail tape measure protein domain-containing protein n=1 Tax=Paenibacillus antibioticophila TaxID=1274374 RepID=A0A920CH22_9BACL|nr:phage tail tape measure protein [Paenibacillus antibioticophila]GIO39295.1 hypothetical protein J41TS12_41560 [Paenibacillus antibioticophila]
MAEDIEVSNLVTKISIDDSGVEQSMAALTRQMKLVQSEFQAASTKLGQHASSQDALKVKADSLSKQLETQGQVIAKLKKQYDEVAESKGKDDRQTQKLETNLNKAVAQYNKLYNELQSTTAEINKQATAWEKASKALDAAAKKMEDIGKKMTAAGQELSVMVTAPLVAVGAASTKASIDFESAFAGVRKTVDATEEEFQKFSQEIRQMSKEMPASATAIAGVAEAAGQLGIKNEALMSFTQTMSDLGVATNMGAEQAATSLARLANITQMPQQNFDRLGATIVALGNNLATTESEITEMALRLAGAGKQIGMTEAQILSFAGSLSSVGIEAEAGGSAFSRVMINIAQAAATGSKDLNNFAAVAGMSVSQFKATFQQDAASALVAFTEGLGRMSKAGENTFAVLDELGLSEIRVRDALLRASNAGDLFRNSMELGTQAWEENTALTNEAAQRYETTASQLKILGNRIVDAAITLGDALVPAIMSVLDALEPMLENVEDAAEWFANLDPEMQKTILTMVAMAAAAGPLLILSGKLVTSIASLIPVVKGLGTALTFLTTNPIGLTITALAALVTLFFSIGNSMAEAKKAAEELAQAQADLQEIQRNGIDRAEIEQTEEKIERINELIDTYNRLIETAAASDAAAMGNNVLALDATAKELGISLKDLEKAANEFGVSLEFITEDGKIAARSMEELAHAKMVLTKAIKDAQRETATEISDQAKQVAARQQEIKVTEDLLSTYKTAKKGSEEWQAAQKQLINQFPQFANGAELNIDAIYGLIDAKKGEIDVTWQNIQAKATEALQIKQTAIETKAAAAEQIQAAVDIAVAQDRITKATIDSTNRLNQMNKELAVMRGEAAALQALVNGKPEDFKAPSAVTVTPAKIDYSSGSKPNTAKTKSEAYKNEALDAAYKQLEHKKRLDQLTLDSELEMLLKIKAAHVKTADERMAIEEKIYSVKKDIIERDKNAQKDYIDHSKQQLQAAYEDRLAREVLSSEEEYKLRDKMLNDQIWLQKNYLEKVKSDSKYSADEKKAIEREVTESIRQQTNERLLLQREYAEETVKLAKEAAKNQIDSINDMSKAVQDALKAKYQAEKQAAEESIKAAQSANEEWKRSQLEAIKTVYDARVQAAAKAADEEIDRINSVYNAQIEAIQKELDALNQAEKQRSREELDSADQKKIRQLEDKITHSHDDYNREQLQKELNKVIAEMNERHRQEELEDTKEALKNEQAELKNKLSEETQAIRDQLATKKEIMQQEYEAQQANINAIYAAQKASLDQQLLDTQAHYAKLLEAKAIQAEAEKMIIQGQQEDILKLLGDFGEGYQAAGQTLGEKMIAGFKPKVDEISSMIAGVIAQIDAARSATLETMAMAASAASAAKSAGSSSSGASTTSQSKSVGVVNNFYSPVTSPSDVSRATTKAAQQLALKL